MFVELVRREKRHIALLALASALAASCLAACFLPRGGKVSPVLAQAAGYAVSRGAPAPSGNEVTADRKTLLQGELLLVSPRHPLPKDFPPPDTRSIRALVGSYLPAALDAVLRKEAVYALCVLETEHPLAGGLTYENGGVSAAQQNSLRLDAFDRFRRVGPLTEAMKKARAAVPAGGESEHQTGLAIDVVLTAPLALGSPDPLLRNEAGKWLAENAWRYGFIRRYAREGEEGACEGVHLRYVGNVHAAAMHALDLPLEEYLALLRREGSLTLTKDGVPEAYIYCAPCPEDWTFPVPEGASVSFSADNTGWAVAAVKPIHTNSPLKH